MLSYVRKKFTDQCFFFQFLHRGAEETIWTSREQFAFSQNKRKWWNRKLHLKITVPWMNDSSAEVAPKINFGCIIYAEFIVF